MPFAQWLQAELDARGWSRAQLAAYAGQETSAVTRWLKHGATPSPAKCVAIAKALKIDESEVLRAAGHLAEMAEDSTAYVAREIDPRAIAIVRLLASDPERFEEWLEIGEVFLRRSTTSR